MAHSNQADKTDKRREEKLARKRENIAKVEATKREKSVWEKLADEKAGIKVDEDTGEETKTKRTRTRKTLAKHRLSHRHGHGKQDNYVCVMLAGGNCVRVKRKQADDAVKNAGAKYVPKHVWRESLKKKVS